jgi:hypothetical protein
MRFESFLAADTLSICVFELRAPRDPRGSHSATVNAPRSVRITFRGLDVRHGRALHLTRGPPRL